MTKTGENIALTVQQARRIARKLHDFAKLNQCDKISLNKVSPAKVKREVAKALKA